MMATASAHSNLVIEDGMVTIPDAPGIGAYPDPAYIRKLDEVK